jgi:hypothetical protein
LSFGSVGVWEIEEYFLKHSLPWFQKKVYITMANEQSGFEQKRAFIGPRLTKCASSIEIS